MLAWIVLVASAFACDAPVTLAELTENLDLADGAFAKLDRAAFETARGSVITGLPCTSERLDARTVARIHGVEGLGAFLARDTDRAAMHVEASVRADPTYRVVDQTPEGHPLRALANAPPAAAETFRFAVESGRTILVDGQVAREAVSGQVAVVQSLDSEDVPLWTALGPADQLLAEARAAKKSITLRPQLLAIAGGALLAGGTAQLAARGSARKYDDLDTPYESLSGLQTSANALSITSMALTAGGLGIGIVGVLPQ